MSLLSRRRSDLTVQVATLELELIGLRASMHNLADSLEVRADRLRRFDAAVNIPEMHDENAAIEAAYRGVAASVRKVAQS